MKFITLGTNVANPEDGRYCTSTYLEVNNEGYIFDLGAPCETGLINNNVDLNTIKGIFITHMHPDHTDNIFSLTKSWAVFNTKAEVEIYFPEEESKKAYLGWVKALHLQFPEDRIRLKTIKSGIFYLDKNIKIAGIRTKHLGEFPSFAFLVEAENKKILFTGDLSYNFSDYPKYILENKTDIVFCELAHFDDIQNIIPIIEKSKTGKIIFNHSRKITENEAFLLKQMMIEYAVAKDNEIFKI